MGPLRRDDLDVVRLQALGRRRWRVLLSYPALAQVVDECVGAAVRGDDAIMATLARWSAASTGMRRRRPGAPATFWDATNRLAQHLAARARRPGDVEVLAKDLVLRDALALALLVAVQEAVDIAYHIAADEGWGVPDSHAAAFDLLADHGVLDRALARDLSGIARVRDRIAHGYASVDHARMWQELPDGLDKLDELARLVAAWLPDEPSA